VTFTQGSFDLVKSERFDENFLQSAEKNTRWLRSAGLVDYPPAVAAMETYADALARGEAPELIWLLEHPPLYTAGTSARAEDLIEAGGLPVFRTGRGGQFTFHGPGQRIVYLMLDLGQRGKDIRAFVRGIESWISAALARLGVEAGCRAGRTGLWVPRPENGPGREDKIAAIGIRVRRWISFHGVSINVDPDLARFGGIVPCGIRDQGVTSLAALGVRAGMNDLDAALLATFPGHFGDAGEADAGLAARFPPHFGALAR
jgi:lipoyl(octanoyl) transferase